MRKLIPVIVMFLLSFAACTAGDEDPGGREASEQDLINSFLFGAGIQFLTGNVFNGQAQIHTCTGNTTDALVYCGVTLPALQGSINSSVSPNLNINLFVANNQISGVFNTVSPLRNNTIANVSFSVRGQVSAPAEGQQPILTLTQVGAVTLADASQGISFTNFRAEMQPDQLVGSFDVDLTGSGTGAARVTINFAAEKGL